MKGGPAILPRVRRVLDDPYSERFVSSISIAEIAVKIQGGKIRMRATELDQLVEDLALRHIAFTHHHADRMHSMPLHHRSVRSHDYRDSTCGNMTLVGSD